MTAGPTSSLRVEKMAAGTNLNTWGEPHLNDAFDRFDTAIAGWLTKALTGNYILTSVNYSADEARTAMLKFTGTGSYTVTIPSVSKQYQVMNATTGVLTITTGAGAAASIESGGLRTIVCDGSNCYDVMVNGQNLKTYIDSASVLGAATSTTSLLIGTGSKALTIIQPGNKFAVGLTLILASAANPVNQMTGILTAYDTGTGAATVVVSAVGGSGTYADWSISVPPVSGVTTARLISTAGLATGGGDLSADRTITVTAASASVVRTGTSTATALTPGDTYSGLAVVTLTDATTIATDMATFINATVTLGGNRTLGAPTNAKPGQSGFIEVVQDGTGSRTLAFASAWKREGGAATLSTAAGAKDYIFYQVITTGLVIYTLIKAPS